MFCVVFYVNFRNNPRAAEVSSLQMECWKRRLRARQSSLSAGRRYSVVILRLVASRSADSLVWSVLKSLHSKPSSHDCRVTDPSWGSGGTPDSSSSLDILRFCRRIPKRVVYIFRWDHQGTCRGFHGGSRCTSIWQPMLLRAGLLRLLAVWLCLTSRKDCRSEFC